MIFDNKESTKIINPVHAFATMMLTSILSKDKPIATINREMLKGKSIYKIFVRSPSSRDYISTNEERIIFFLCDFKIFSIIRNKVKEVESCHKFREVKKNILAYNTLDDMNRKTNVIKFIRIGHSDYQIHRVYEETEGKLIEFLAQDGKLLTLIKPDKSEKHHIKVFNVDDNLKCKLKYLIPTYDETFIGNLQTVNYYQGTMIPANNDLYNVLYNGEKPIVHYYKNVMSLKNGKQLAFCSPIMNTSFRKMIYFLTNKSSLESKIGVIIPFITDNYSVFMGKKSNTQISQFINYGTEEDSGIKTDILNFSPLTQ